MKNKVKCKNCKERYVGCHSECVHYIKYREERDNILKMKYEQAKEEDIFNEYKVDETLKLLRSRGQKRLKK